MDSQPRRPDPARSVQSNKPWTASHVTGIVHPLLLVSEYSAPSTVIQIQVQPGLSRHIHQLTASQDKQIQPGLSNQISHGQPAVSRLVKTGPAMASHGGRISHSNHATPKPPRFSQPHMPVLQCHVLYTHIIIAMLYEGLSNNVQPCPTMSKHAQPWPAS